MLATLYGENSFGLSQEFNRICQAFEAEHGSLAIERIDAEEVDLNALQSSLASLPFLSSRKLVVLRNPGSNKQFVENYERILGQVADTTDLVIVEPKLDKRTAYYKFLSEKTDFKQFQGLDQNKLQGWLINYAMERGSRLGVNEARHLIDRVGVNQAILAHELDKLLLYNPDITLSSVDLLTEQTPQTTIFQLLEAAFSGNSKRALEIYDQQRAQKTEPPVIISMLSWQLHLLAVLHYSEGVNLDQVARDARQKPYVLSKSQRLASSLSQEQIKKLIRDLLLIDNKSKSTSIDIDEALKHYLVSIK